MRPQRKRQEYFKPFTIPSPNIGKSYFKPRNISSQSRCRLMALPAELRNTIYEMALADYTWCRTVNLGCPRQPNLLLTCKQIYDEAINSYYASSSFLASPYFVPFHSDRVHMLKSIARKFGPKRCKHITRIGFHEKIGGDYGGLKYVLYMLDDLQEACTEFEQGAIQAKVHSYDDEWPESRCAVFWTGNAVDNAADYSGRETK